MGTEDRGAQNSDGLDALTDEELRERLFELGRRDETSGLAWSAVQAELSKRRDALEPLEGTTTPLRRLVLDYLTEKPRATPSLIASDLGRSLPVVSRVLGLLVENRAVKVESDPDDGRLRRYSRADSANTADAVEESDQANRVQHLHLAVTAAVLARRQWNQLDFSIDRLRRVLAEAETLQDDGLALLARRELVTALRQAGKDEEQHLHLEILGEMELGRDGTAPELVLPASAHLAYELGRSSLGLRKRLDYLSASAFAFMQLDESGSHLDDWRSRAAWATLSAAEAWRVATEVGLAHGLALKARTAFADRDNDYGIAESSRLAGFCLRLRGDFLGARKELERALAVCEASRYRRCHADVLLQLGETLRASGNYRLARPHLEEAVAMARDIGRPATEGFARSSLAALAFAEADLDSAWKAGVSARNSLGTGGPGSALNLRRLAVVAREQCVGSSSSWETTSGDLFDEASRVYESLRSPAGAAASYVGCARLEARCGKDPSESIGKLLDLGTTRIGRQLLPLDPWIPSLVDGLAKEADSSDLAGLAQWVLLPDESEFLLPEDEMAGEPRLYCDLLAS